MAYQENIPQPTDQLNDSQADLLGNFQAIDTYVNINHVDFDDSAGDQGKHKWVAFPTQNFTPPIVPGEVTVYAPISAVTSVRELSVINQLGTTVPMTASILSSTPAPVAGSSGWTLVPSGIQFRFGKTGNLVAGTNIVSLVNLGFPTFNAIMKVFITPLNPAGTAGGNTTCSMVSIDSTTQITIYSSGINNAGANVLVIGY